MAASEGPFTLFAPTNDAFAKVSTFDNDDDDDILKHGEGGSGGGGGGDAEVLQICFIHISPLKF